MTNYPPDDRSIEHAVRLLVDAYGELPQGLRHFQVDRIEHRTSTLGQPTRGGEFIIRYRMDADDPKTESSCCCRRGCGR